MGTPSTELNVMPRLKCVAMFHFIQDTRSDWDKYLYIQNLSGRKMQQPGIFPFD